MRDAGRMFRRFVVGLRELSEGAGAWESDLMMAAGGLPVGSVKCTRSQEGTGKLWVIKTTTQCTTNATPNGENGLRW